MKKSLFVLFLSFLFVPFVYGDSYNYDRVISFASTDEYSNCSNGRYYAVINNGSSWVAKWNAGAPVSDGVDHVTCTTVADGSSFQFDLEFSKNRTIITQDYTYILKSGGTSFNLNEINNDVASITAITNQSANVSSALDMSQCRVGGTNCIISAMNVDDDAETFLKIEYVDTEGFTHYFSATIMVKPHKIYLNIGGYGSCSMGGWKDTNKLYSKKYTSGMSFPSCTSTKEYINFAGWTPVGGMTSGTSVISDVDTTLNNCKNVPGFISGSGSIPNGDNDYYYACYAYVDAFELISDGFTPSPSGNYSINGAYIYKKTSMSMPDIKLSSSSKYEFVGWLGSDGVVHKAGETVSIAAGSGFNTFRAQYKQKQVDDSHSYEVGISATAGATTLEELVNTGVAFNNCKLTSGSGILTANVSGGQCIITPAAGGDAVVTSTVKNGTATDTYVIKIHVYTDNSRGEETQYSGLEDEYNIEWTDVEATTSITQSTNAGGCSTFYISSGILTPYYITGGSVSQHRFNLYNVQSACSNKTFRSLCLDPGLEGAYGGMVLTYSFEKELDLKDSYDRAIQKLATKVAGSGSIDQTKYAAVNFVARVISNKAGKSRNSPMLYPTHYEVYRYMASINSLSSTTFNFGSVYSFDSTFASYVRTYYSEAITAYKTPYTESANSSKDVTLKNDNKTWEWSADGKYLIVTRTGKMKIPSGSGTPSVSNNCSNIYGYTCSSYLSSSTDANGYRDYKFTVKVQLTNTTKVPDNDDNRLAFILSFANSDSLGNAFYITHKTNSSYYQRMVAINTGNNEYMMYVDISGGGCMLSHPSLNPSNCTSASHCTVNRDFFVELKCCDLIKDKSSYAFKELCDGGDCTYDNYSPVCEKVGGATKKTYQINEAVTTAGAKQMSCIIDVDNISKTKVKKDAVGNEFALENYENNQYCTVSCKEDWYFNTGVYGNFVGSNAVLAGSYFVIRDDLFINGKRSCFTTYIDYNQYMKDVKRITENLISSWDVYSELRTVYSALNELTESDCVETNPVYYKSTDSTTHYHCTQYDCRSFKCETYDWKDCTKYTTDADGKRVPYTCYGCCRYCAEYYQESDDFCTNSYVCYRKSSNTSLANCDCYSQDTVYREYTCKEFSLTTSRKPYDYYTSSNGTHFTNYVGPTTYSTSNTTKGSGIVTNIYYDGSVVEYGKFAHTAGSCKTETCSQMKTRYLNEIKGQIDSARSTVQSYINELNNTSKDFAMCQNFMMVTTSMYDEFNDGSGAYSIYNKGLTYTSTNLSSPSLTAMKIETKFSPFISYSYEEEEYMKMIGSDNYMVPYSKLNDGRVVGYDKVTGDPVKASKWVYSTEGSNTTSKEDTVYDSFSANNGKKRLDTGSVSTFTQYNYKNIYVCPVTSGYETIYNVSNAQCAQGTFYYYQIHYVKQTLSNGSYWKNKGYWYINNNDEKSHADTLSAASSRAYVRYARGQEDYWSLYGGYNVFPISMDTRRNLYQYIYTFYNIGSYNDGALGRLMGGEVDATGAKKFNGHNRTVLSFNTHACFYEVYESICKCCGQQVSQYTNEESGVDTWTYARKYGYSMSSSIKSNKSTLALFTNSVSLSNLSSGASRVLGANWTAQTPFYYAGDRYTTNQGAELLNGIQSAGDKIYDDYPEYSYTLTPSAMAEIRSYNDSHTYVVDSKDLILYGSMAYSRTGVDGTSYSSYEVAEGQEENRIRFNHYGSKFLEKEMSKYITSEYRGRTLPEKNGPSSVCSTTNGSTTTLGQDSYTRCRWVDYITSTGYRLAFK